MTLEEMRKAAGKTPEEMAKHYGMTVERYLEYETGRKKDGILEKIRKWIGGRS